MSRPSEGHPSPSKSATGTSDGLCKALLATAATYYPAEIVSSGRAQNCAPLLSGESQTHLRLQMEYSHIQVALITTVTHTW